MARLLGEARVSVLPDGTRFKPEAEAQLKKAAAGLRATATIGVKLDDKELQAKRKVILAQVDDLKSKVARVRIDANDKDAAAKIAQINAALTLLSHRVAKAKTDVEITQAEANVARINAALGKFAIKKVKAKADVDTGAGLSKLDYLKLKLAEFGHKVATARANINISTARSKLGELVSFIRTRFARDAESAAGGAGKGAATGFAESMARSAAMQSPGITAAIAAGFAALPAALGVVGALGGAALGAGIIFGAEKLIKSQTKNITQQMQQLQTQMGGKSSSPTSLASQQLSIQNTQATINRLSGGNSPSATAVASKQLAIQNTEATIKRLEATKKLTAAQQQQLSIAKQRLVIEKQSLAQTQNPALSASQQQQLSMARQRLVIEKQSLAAAQGKGQGTPAQRAQLAQDKAQLAQYAKYQAAFQNLNNALTNAKFAFLQFAIIATKPLLKPFTDAVNYLSGQMKGPLAKTFRDFFTAVGPLVRPMLQAFLEIIKGILPGMTDLLKRARGPLTDLFIGFGKIVGIDLGRWFKTAAPYVKDSAKYFLALLHALGTVGTLLVKFGGVSAQAFGNPALKGFGPLIIKIAESLIKLVKPAFDGWVSVMAPIAKLLLRIVAPILQFLAVHPALVKAIFAIAAAWMIASKAIGIVNIALRAMKIAELGTPWIALATVIVLAAILIVTHWKTIAAFFVNVWKHIWSGFIGPLINFFTETIPHAFSVTLNWLKKNWPMLVPILLGPVGIAAGLIIKYHNQIFNFMKRIWSDIIGFLHHVWANIANAIHDAWSHIANFFSGFWRDMKHLFLSVVSDIGHGLNDTWNAIKGTAIKVWNGIKGFFSGFWSGLKTTVHDAVHWIADTIAGVWGAIKNTAHTVWSKIVSVIHDAWNGIKAVIAKPINVVIGFINTLVSGADAILSAIGIKGGGPHGGPIGQIPKIPGYRSGGRVNAGTHETADDVLVRVSKNETIVSADHSRKLAPYFAAAGVPGYAKGGVPSLAGYVNPLRGARYTPERIDQGVDFAGSGPIGAIGAAKILETSGAGWPGGPFMSYKLLSGALSGLNVFIAENIRPRVRAGQVVKAGQHIADMFNGGTGIETGFADPSGRSTLSQTAAAGAISGANLPANGATQVGQVFDELLSALGVARAPNFGLASAGKIPGSIPGSSGSPLSSIVKFLKSAGSALGGLLITGIQDLLQVAGIPKPVLDAIRSLFGINAPGGTGSGWVKKLTGGMGKFLVGKVGGWLRHAAFDALKRVFAPQINAASAGSGPAGSGTSAGAMANGIQLYQYLLHNLFGGNKIAAAGATASIWGESGWNPFAQGTGGRGLIGWTPPSTISNADFKGGMRTQLPAILRFVTSSGDSGVISQMFRATSVTQAANEWMRGVERAGISDVHPTGINLATQIMKSHANGGVIHEPVVGFGLRSGLGYSFGEGGRRERVLSDAETQKYENDKRHLDAVRQQNRLLAEQNTLLARIVNNTGNTAKTLGGTGRGVL